MVLILLNLWAPGITVRRRAGRTFRQTAVRNVAVPPSVMPSAATKYMCLNKK
jgi:hypothetical protein